MLFRSVNNYWAENFNNVLRIKSTQDLRTNTASEDTDQFVVADATPRGELVMRYEYDVKKLYLLTAPLRNWCVKRQVSYEGLLEELKLGRTNGRMVKKRMGKGTRTNLPAVNVLCITCEWVDEQTEKAIEAIGTYQSNSNGDIEPGRGETVH